LQKPLPKLPVPDLSSTMDKYLSLLSTVVSQQELDSTRQHVQELTRRGGWGEKLQNHLLQRQAEMDNWVRSTIGVYTAVLVNLCFLVLDSCCCSSS